MEELKEKKRTIWNNPLYAKQAGVISSVLSLRMQAKQARNETGERVFSKEDLSLLEPIFQKVKEIGLNCIK